MRIQILASVFAIAALVPATPAAVVAQDGDVRAFTFGGNRGRIGVMVDVEPDAATDKLGARLQSVVPDGPADRAGLEAGDIIVVFNGQSLAGLAEDDGMSGPGQRLVELAQALDPGDEVEIEYRRGDKTRSATITADSMQGTFTLRGRGGDWSFGPRMNIDPDVWVEPHLEFPHDMNMVFGGGGIAGLDLADLNEDLAGYFGTSEGALVMKAPRDSTLSLKGGDVIVAIDGRGVESPSHAFRILRSYNAGETASIAIVRQQNRMTIEWTVPEYSGRSFFRQPDWRTPRKRVKKDSRA